MTSRPTTEPAALPVTDLLHVEPWGLRPAASGLPPVEEEIDVSNFNGNDVITITDIAGLSIKNFTHIQVKMQAVTRSASGSHILFRLRREGGAFSDETYRWQDNSSVAANPSTSALELTDATTVTVQEGTLWLSSVSQPCPTGFFYTNQNTADSFPGFHDGMTTGGARVHDAMRFIANGGGGSETWVSGQLVVTGYRFKVGKLYSKTWSTESTTTFNLAPGEVIADAFFHDIDMTTSATAIGMEVGTGDVFDTDYRASRLDSTKAHVNASFGGIYFTQTGGGQTGKYGFGTIFNLQTAAPVCAAGICLDPDGTDTEVQELRVFANAGTTSYDQIRVFASSSTVASGTVWIQTYKPRTTIHLAQDLTSFGATTFAASNLKKNNAAWLVAVSLDAERAAADARVWAKVGDGGPTATDALYLKVNENFDQATTNTLHHINDSTSKTGGAFFAWVTGLPIRTNTMVIQGADLTSGVTSDCDMNRGSWETREVHDYIEFGNDTQNWNAGTAYIIGFG